MGGDKGGLPSTYCNAPDNSELAGPRCTEVRMITAPRSINKPNWRTGQTAHLPPTSSKQNKRKNNLVGN